MNRYKPVSMKELETKQEGEQVWWVLDSKTQTYVDGMHFSFEVENRAKDSSRVFGSLHSPKRR